MCGDGGGGKGGWDWMVGLDVRGGGPWGGCDGDERRASRGGARGASQVVMHMGRLMRSSLVWYYHRRVPGASDGPSDAHPGPIPDSSLGRTVSARAFVLAWSLYVAFLPFPPLFARTTGTPCRFERVLAPVSLSRIQRLIDTGRIDPTEPITMSVLWRSGAVRRIPDGVKLVCQVCLLVVVSASEWSVGELLLFFLCHQGSCFFVLQSFDIISHTPLRAFFFLSPPTAIPPVVSLCSGRRGTR